MGHIISAIVTLIYDMDLASRRKQVQQLQQANPAPEKRKVVDVNDDEDEVRISTLVLNFWTKNFAFLDKELCSPTRVNLSETGHECSTSFFLQLIDSVVTATGDGRKGHRRGVCKVVTNRRREPDVWGALRGRGGGGGGVHEPDGQYR